MTRKNHFLSYDDISKEWDEETSQCLKTTKSLYYELLNEETPKGTCEKILTLGNEIQVISRKTGKTIQTFINIPGLLIQGCSFKNLHRLNWTAIYPKKAKNGCANMGENLNKMMNDE